MKKLFFVLLITVFANGLNANTPTLESMLRHGSNVDLNQKLINGKFLVKKVEAAQVEAGQNQSTVFTPFAFQVAAYKENTKHKFMFLRFNGERAESEFLSQIKHGSVGQLSKQFKSHVVSGIFFSQLVSLLGNEGDTFITFLKEQGIDVKLNSEQMNQQKVALLKEYKKYLEQKKDEEESDDQELENPLSPTEPERKEVVKKILDSPFFESSEDFKLVKIGNKFNWIFEKENVYFQFNFEHQLMRFELKSADGIYVFLFDKYKEFPGGAIFPQEMVIKYPDGSKYQIVANRLTVYKSNEDSFNKKVNYFADKLQTENITPSPVMFLAI